MSVAGVFCMHGTQFNALIFNTRPLEIALKLLLVKQICLKPLCRWLEKLR